MRERWAELKDAFAAAVDLQPVERTRFLSLLAATDPDLHRDLAALLDADSRIGDGAAAGEAGVAVADPFGLAGTVISHFRVLDVLGSGGMGVVYRAEDERLGRTVALKFLLPQYSFDATARERFLKEARAASALEHPNVCTVYESGQSETGRVFLAMACYPGDTLKARLAGDPPLDTGEAIDIARQVLDGLGAAHRAGIVHRDLKPGNLLLGTDGLVRILDFGLARARDDIDLTGPGVPPGTVAYMSPEQLAGEAVDQRTDLWSFGVVFYEMLTRRTPFRRGHELSTVHSILNEKPVPPSAVRREVPKDLDAIVERLLQRDPADRYTATDEVLADLRAVAEGQSVGSRSDSWHRIAAATLVVAAAVVALAAAFMAPWPVTRSEVPEALADVTPNSIAVLPFADLSGAPDQAYFSEGIAEEILNALHRVSELRVTSRTSAFSFRNTALPVTEIARRLGVKTLLGGNVRRNDEGMRITAWLVDGQTGLEVWSESFDGQLADVSSVQTEIARAVARALELRVAPSHSVAVPRATLSDSAHEAYLHGLFHWHRRTPPDIEQAIRYFERAIQHDSTYARAYAGLALSHAVQPLLAGLRPEELVPRIEAAAMRAIVLDPSLADPYAALGYGYHQQWRWADAERALDRALELDPNHNIAMQWYGEHLAKMGRAEEAEQLLRRAVALDPLSTIAHTNLGLVLWLGGRVSEAITQFELTARLDPDYTIAHLFLFRTRLSTGDIDGAVIAGRRWTELSRQVQPEDVEMLARGLQPGGDRAATLAVLARWESLPARLGDVVFSAAVLGETDYALAALERAFEDRSPHMAALRTAWFTRPLRDEPRYHRMVEAMGFPSVPE